MLLLLLEEHTNTSTQAAACQANGRINRLTLLPDFVNRIFGYVATAIYGWYYVGAQTIFEILFKNLMNLNIKKHNIHIEFQFPMDNY